MVLKYLFQFIIKTKTWQIYALLIIRNHINTPNLVYIENGYLTLSITFRTFLLVYYISHIRIQSPTQWPPLTRGCQERQLCIALEIDSYNPKMTIYSVYIINKAGGLIYQHDHNVPRLEIEKTFSFPLEITLKVFDEKIVVAFGERDGIKGGRLKSGELTYFCTIMYSSIPSCGDGITYFHSHVVPMYLLSKYS